MIDSEWSGEGETGKHRVKTPQTQALIYTQNRLKIDHEIGAIDTRHTSYLHPASAAADRWGSLRDDCCYMVRRLSYRWPAKWWQFLYSWLVFRPLAIGSFCIPIDEWCQGTSARGQQHARGYTRSIKVCSVWDAVEIFVPWSNRVQHLLEWLCPLTPSNPSDYFLKTEKCIMRDSLSSENEREKVCHHTRQ